MMAISPSKSWIVVLAALAVVGLEGCRLPVPLIDGVPRCSTICDPCFGYKPTCWQNWTCQSQCLPPPAEMPPLPKPATAAEMPPLPKPAPAKEVIPKPRDTGAAQPAPSLPKPPGQINEAVEPVAPLPPSVAPERPRPAELPAEPPAAGPLAPNPGS